MFSYAARARELLKEQGIDVCLLKLCKIKPINPKTVEFAKGFKSVWFFEEGIKNGGIARTFSDKLTHVGFTGRYHLKAIHDRFVKQMSVNDALGMLKLDSEGIRDVVIKDLTDEKKT